jgi:O-antigen/teichoic acid export membrane protein
MLELILRFKKIISIKFIKDSIWNLASSTFIAASGIIINTLIGNFYHVEGLGLFNKALAIYSIISILSNFGLTESTVKHVAEFKKEKYVLDILVSTSLYITLRISFIVISLLYFYLFINPHNFINKPFADLLINLIWGLPLFGLNKVFLGFLNGMRQMKAYAFTQFCRWLIILLFIIVSILQKKSLSTMIIAFPVAELIILMWLIFYTSQFFSFTFKRLDFWQKKHLHFGSRSFLVSSIGEVNDKADILIISLFLSNYFIGLYSFASSIAKGILLLYSIIAVNFNPIISELWANHDIEGLKQHIKKIRRVSFYLMIFLSIFFSIAYPLYIKLFMDVSYCASIPIFYILLLGVSFISVFYFVGGILSMTGHPNIQLKITYNCFIFNAIFNIIMLLLTGIIGSAIATSMSYILIIFYINYYSQKKLGISIMYKFKKKLCKFA